MENLYIKDLVSFSGKKLYCVQTSWSINQVVSYLIEKDIPACPVIHSKIKNGVAGRILGCAILKDLALKLKRHTETGHLMDAEGIIRMAIINITINL